MKQLRYSLFIPVVLFTLSSCNLVSDSDNTSNSDTEGYITYTNKTLGISVLAPENWFKEITIGGEYNMRPDKNNTFDSISVSSSVASRLLDQNMPDDISLNEFHQRWKSWYSENNIGPQFELAMITTSLSGLQAKEVAFSYTPAGGDRRSVREIYTVLNGKVYFLRWYAKAGARDKYLKEFKTIRKSYKIID